MTRIGKPSEKWLGAGDLAGPRRIAGAELVRREAHQPHVTTEESTEPTRRLVAAIQPAALIAPDGDEVLGAVRSTRHTAMAAGRARAAPARSRRRAGRELGHDQRQPRQLALREEAQRGGIHDQPLAIVREAGGREPRARKLDPRQDFTG